MKKMSNKFLLGYVYLVISLCEGNNLYTAMDDVIDIHDERIEKLNKIFSYTLQKYLCMQVIIDESPFSNALLKDIHQTHTLRPIIVSNTDNMEMKCKAFIIIAKNIFKIPDLIDGLPLYAENRLIIFVKSHRYLVTQFIMKKVNIFGNIDVFIVTTDDFTVGYRMGQAVRKFSTIEDLSGVWSDREKHLNFHGRTIKVLTYNCSIFSKTGAPNNEGKPSFEDGAEMVIFKEMADRLNLTYKIYSPKSYENKIINPFFPTDRWYEKPLQDHGKNDVDMAFCCLLNSSKRRKSHLTMSESLMLLCFRFLVPRPRPIQSEWYGIFKPFSNDLWFSIAMAVGLTTFILQKLTVLTTPILETQGIAKYNGLGGSFLQLVSILVLSSVPHSTEHQGPSRYLLTCWALFTVIITTSFSSSLASNLATQLYSPKINNIDDFIRAQYAWLYVKKPDTEEMFNIANKDHARWSVRAKFAKDFAKYNALLRKGKYILWGAQVENGFVLPYEELIGSDLLNKFETSSDCFIEYFTGFAFRVGSSFLPPFNHLIQRYRESGLISKIVIDMNKIRRKKYPYVRRVFRFTKSKLAGPQGISLRHLIGIFEIWAAGTFLSITVFILEFFQKFKL